MIKDSIIKIINIRFLQHFAFWVLSFLILLQLFNASNQVEKIDIIYTAIFHVSLVTGVYINLLILIPLVLRKNRYLFYILLFAVDMISTAAFNEITFNKLIDYVLPGYYFISFYEFTDILKFVFVYIGLTTLLKLSKGWFQLLDTNQKLLRTEKEKISNELVALRSQINPHFLFNSLNGIYSLALKKSKRTPEIILLLSELMRYMLYESNEERVLLKKEIRYMKNYIELQKLRSDEHSEVKLNITGSVGDHKIAPLLFLPFLENSFKHGIKGDPMGGFINIDLDINKGSLKLMIENNKGIVEEVEKGEFRGIGLRNARRRLELLYPEKHQLDIQENSEIFSIHLHLDLS
jgi:sensor histidine kinase YesM